MSSEGVNLYQHASITSNIETSWLCTVRLQNLYTGNKKYQKNTIIIIIIIIIINPGLEMCGNLSYRP